MAAVAAAAAGALAAVRANNAKDPYDNYFSSRDNMLRSPLARISTPAPVAWITITCLEEKGDNVARRVVLPHTFEELKQIGVTTYGAPFIRDGAPFIRVLNEQGAEINDIRVVRKRDRVVFASERGDEKFTRVTITCSEKEDALEKRLVLPRSLEELKWIGEKIYGAPFVRVLSEEGYEINDILVLADGDQIIFARQEQPEDSIVRVTTTCLEKRDAEGKLMVLEIWAST